jgi:hypothetical protein
LLLVEQARPITSPEAYDVLRELLSEKEDG